MVDGVVRFCDDAGRLHKNATPVVDLQGWLEVLAFLLDELTPSGVKLFVALGWPDDEKGNGYAAAKDKVAKRVPAQDWAFIEQEGFPGKSQETPSQGGRPKQVVAISANGMKHLLAPSGTLIYFRENLRK